MDRRLAALYSIPRAPLLASGSRDGTLRLWEVATGKPAGVLKGHQGSALDAAFSPDGKQLASVGYDRTVRLWDVGTRAAVAVLPGEEGYRITYSADGRLIAASSHDGNVRLWDAQTHDELANLPHGNRVYGLAFSPDGTRLATACGDNTIRLWTSPEARKFASCAATRPTSMPLRSAPTVRDWLRLRRLHACASGTRSHRPSAHGHGTLSLHGAESLTAEN